MTKHVRHCGGLSGLCAVICHCYVLGLGLKLELRFVKSLHFVFDFSESILEPKSGKDAC